MMPAWHQKAIDLCSEGKALQIAAHTVQYFYCQANVLLQAHHIHLFIFSNGCLVYNNGRGRRNACVKQVSKQATPLKRKHWWSQVKTSYVRLSMCFAMVAVIYLHKAHTNTFSEIGWTSGMTFEGETKKWVAIKQDMISIAWRLPFSPEAITSRNLTKIPSQNTLHEMIIGPGPACSSLKTFIFIFTLCIQCFTFSNGKLLNNHSECTKQRPKWMKGSN